MDTCRQWDSHHLPGHWVRLGTVGPAGKALLQCFPRGVGQAICSGVGWTSTQIGLVCTRAVGLLRLPICSLFCCEPLHGQLGDTQHACPYFQKWVLKYANTSRTDQGPLSPQAALWEGLVGCPALAVPSLVRGPGQQLVLRHQLPHHLPKRSLTILRLAIHCTLERQDGTTRQTNKHHTAHDVFRQASRSPCQ